jgi:hypothetical protein
MLKKVLIILLCLNYSFSHAQQWITKKYQYDSLINVKYGTATNFLGGVDTLKMDIYAPICSDVNQSSKRPLLIWVHGGAFLAGDKSETSITNMCRQFARRGYVTASINYRLGFVADDAAHTCNYPNYNCIFATDTSEWSRAYFRAIQDGKGALRYLLNRASTWQIDPSNVFIAGESAGSFVALGVALLDTLIEKPFSAYAINNAPKPAANTNTCQYNVGKTLSNTTITRPDLGSIEGIIEPSAIKYTIKGIGNIYGGMMSDLLKMQAAGKPKPAIYSYHQPCDIVVPIDSGAVFAGLSWCMTNGYNCFGISNTPKVFGSRTISNWNANGNYGYNIHNEFTTKQFPYSFLLGAGSCVDQVNNPCHAYDNYTLRENNLAMFFAPLVSTSPICSPITSGSDNFYGKDTWHIFPNPCTDILNIEGEQLTDVKLVFHNIFGQTFQKTGTPFEKMIQVDINDLPSGIYILSVQYKNGEIHSSKILKD